MAQDKKRQATPKHSGFDGDPIGTIHPRGSTIKKNPDGTITITHPKKETKKKK